MLSTEQANSLFWIAANTSASIVYFPLYLVSESSKRRADDELLNFLTTKRCHNQQRF